jgi:hypothetical protein
VKFDLFYKILFEIHTIGTLQNLHLLCFLKAGHVCLGLLSDEPGDVFEHSLAGDIREVKVGGDLHGVDVEFWAWKVKPAFLATFQQLACKVDSSCSGDIRVERSQPDLHIHFFPLRYSYFGHPLPEIRSKAHSVVV